MTIGKLILGVPLLISSLLSCSCAQQPRSICSIGDEDIGSQVRIEATFVSDRMHGAFLEDAACPAVSLPIGYAAENADASVRSFEAKLWKWPIVGRVVSLNIDALGEVTVSGEGRSSAREIRLVKVIKVDEAEKEQRQ